MALMQMISFTLLSPTGVTLPFPVAIEHPGRNAHTSWMIPTITLRTLHYGAISPSFARDENHRHKLICT